MNAFSKKNNFWCLSIIANCVNSTSLNAFFLTWYLLAFISVFLLSSPHWDFLGYNCNKFLALLAYTALFFAFYAISIGIFALKIAFILNGFSSGIYHFKLNIAFLGNRKTFLHCFTQFALAVLGAKPLSRCNNDQELQIKQLFYQCNFSNNTHQFF